MLHIYKALNIKRITTPVNKITTSYSLTEGLFYLFFTGQVFTPIKVYKGQELTRLVNTKTPATTNNTIPNTPVITLVKYNTAITAASNNRITRSALPIFFFIHF